VNWEKDGRGEDGEEEGWVIWSLNGRSWEKSSELRELMEEMIWKRILKKDEIRRDFNCEKKVEIV
jgi:hypothetical protein